MARVDVGSDVAAPVPEPTLSVEVLYCARPGHTDSVALQLPVGSTVLQALVASGVLDRHGLLPEGLSVGIWCRVQPLHTRLRDRDRVEIYRPLRVDPKEARRQRYQLHKTRLQAARARQAARTGR
jgi:uncharacterized protein